MAKSWPPLAFTAKLASVGLREMRDAAVSIAILRERLGGVFTAAPDALLLKLLVDCAEAAPAMADAVRASIAAALLPKDDFFFRDSMRLVSAGLMKSNVRCLPWARLSECIKSMQLGVCVLPACFVTTDHSAEAIAVGAISHNACDFEIARIACLIAENLGEPDSSQDLTLELATIVGKISTGAKWSGFSLIQPAPPRDAAAAQAGVAAAAARPHETASSAAAGSAAAAATVTMSDAALAVHAGVSAEAIRTESEQSPTYRRMCAAATVFLAAEARGVTADRWIPLGGELPPHITLHRLDLPFDFTKDKIVFTELPAGSPLGRSSPPSESAAGAAVVHFTAGGAAHGGAGAGAGLVPFAPPSPSAAAASDLPPSGADSGRDSGGSEVRSGTASPSAGGVSAFAVVGEELPDVFKLGHDCARSYIEDGSGAACCTGRADAAVLERCTIRVDTKAWAPFTERTPASGHGLVVRVLISPKPGVTRPAFEEVLRKLFSAKCTCTVKLQVAGSKPPSPTHRAVEPAGAPADAARAGTESVTILQPKARVAAAVTGDPKKVSPDAVQAQTPLADITGRRSAFARRSLVGELDNAF